MATPGSGAKGPGQGRGGRPEGFSFGDDKKGGGRDRGDRRGGPGGRDKRGGGGSSFRVVNELSHAREGAHQDRLRGREAPLQEVLKALKPLHLRSIEDLDFNTRGKLITSLARVQRQAKPKPSEAPAAEARPAEAPAAEAGSRGGRRRGSRGRPRPRRRPRRPRRSAPRPPAAAAPRRLPPRPSPRRPPVDPKVQAYGDVMFTVGLIWRAVGDTDRASSAFELAGRQPTEADLVAPRRRKSARSAPTRGERPDRGPQGRAARPQERPRAPARHKTELFVSSGDWQADAKKLEELGRTRDAGRIHEKNKSFADASRALRGGRRSRRRPCAAPPPGRTRARLEALARQVQARGAGEGPREGRGVDAADELARQARELRGGGASSTSGRGSSIRPARPTSGRRSCRWRARPTSAPRTSGGRGPRARPRGAEAHRARRSLRRGDACCSARARRPRRWRRLKPLPPTKAFHFMEKLKLADEAKAFAREELEKAEAAEQQGPRGALVRAARREGQGRRGVPGRRSQGQGGRACSSRWASSPRRPSLAEASANLDKAQELFAKAGDTANAERVKALPRPEPKPKAPSGGRSGLPSARRRCGRDPGAERADRPRLTCQNSDLPRFYWERGK